MTYEPKLKERFSQLDDEALLRIVRQDSAEYRPEALLIAQEEIKRRGLDLTDSESEGGSRVKANQLKEVMIPYDEDELEDDLPTSLLCPTCGRELRTAVLLDQKQVIAVFEDNREQRFVRIFVCPQCGTADMFVDFNTEVED